MIIFVPLKKYIMNYSQSLTAPIFELISKIADQNSQKCFVVGGFVRDLLLKRGVAKDIDIVTLGSGIELAEKVNRRKTDALRYSKRTGLNLKIFLFLQPF